MAGRNAVSLEAGWLLILKDLGVRPDNVLRRAQLPGDLFSRKSARLSVDEYFRMWNALEAARLAWTNPQIRAEVFARAAQRKDVPPPWAAVAFGDEAEGGVVTTLADIPASYDIREERRHAER